MAIQREIWEGTIVEKIYAANPHLVLCVNADQYVLAGKVVHIPQGGDEPGRERRTCRHGRRQHRLGVIYQTQTVSMKRLFILSLIGMILLMAGCARHVVPVRTDVEIKSTERIVDTVTRIVQDQSLVKALLECDSLGRVRIRELTTENGRLIQQNLTLHDNLLQVQAQGESQERVREVIKTDTVRIYVEVPVQIKETQEVYKLHWWQRWLVWIGLFYLARVGFRIAVNWKTLTFKTLLKLL